MKKEEIKCPKCGKTSIQKFGIDNNLMTKPSQKYRCNDCHYVWREVDNLTKRIIIISDPQCGANTGLTPPPFQLIYPEPTPDQKKLQDFRRESWIWFENQIEKYKPFDICIGNGDLIDGRQEKSGGSELIEPSRVKQCEMASYIINRIGATKNYISRGTPYHTGKLESWEDIVAEKTNAHIENILRLDVNGCLIFARHHIGRAASPQGRYTPLARMGIWEDLKVAGTQFPKVNIMIFSHVHYVSYMGHGNNRLLFTTPALQGATNFGELRCEGIIDYGFTVIDIFKDGTFSHPNFVTKKQEVENQYLKVE